MSRKPRRQPARRALWAIIAGIGWVLSSPAAIAQDQDGAVEAEAIALTLSQTQAYQIDAGSDLGSALDAVASLNDLQIAYSSDLVEGRTAPALQGEYTLEQALDALLAGSGLEAAMVGDNALVVRRLAPPPTTQSEPAPTDVASARRAGVEEIIVTGQKKAERLQDVPISISAFSMEQLDAQKIEGGFDLLRGVPNVTFSKSNFSGYNFSIRGIGTQAVSATTDPGVAVSFNNTTLIVNRLFEQEYLDIERVEVLRGPQGTLFGRNATAGVVNVISAKPVIGEALGEIKLEGGNYNAKRIRGHYNIPLGDTLALRAAYASTVRDGYGYNEASEVVNVTSDVDNRDLWTGRLTLGWEPNDRTRVNLMWERFEEDDRRTRTSKQLCHRDPGRDVIDGVRIEPDPNGQFTGPGSEFAAVIPYITSSFSQGCLAGSMYESGAYGTVNGASLPYVQGTAIAQALAGVLSGFVPGFGGSAGVGFNPWHQNHSNNGGLTPPLGIRPANTAPCLEATAFPYLVSFDICNPDPYGGRMQSTDLRSIYSELEPEYRAGADIFELSVDFNLSDDLVLSSQSVYTTDSYYATQDYNRFRSDDFWNKFAGEACGRYPLELGGQVFPDFTGTDCRAGSPTGLGSFAGGHYADLFTDPVTGEQGVFCDPQLGCSKQLRVQDLSRVESSQYNQEFRIVSSFSGDWNFSVGANFTRFETMNDYFVFSNAFTQLLHFAPFNPPQTTDPNAPCPVGGEGVRCRYVDPNPLASIDGDGHNYFRSANPYRLNSSAIFGETYWNVTDTFKLTLGLRFTWDEKVFTPIPSQLLLTDYRELGSVPEGAAPPPPTVCGPDAPDCPLSGNAPGGRGYVANPDIVQTWREPTGRIVLDWKPDIAGALGLNWLDETMLYASLARGYKGGGANPPTVAPPSGLILAQASGGAAGPTFKAEYVNALEIGAKNTLWGGAVTLNANAFYYDYTDYQVSKIVDRSAANENFDATLWGMELEAMFAPTVDTLFNASIGYLRTRIADGEESLDLMDRTQGGNQSFTGPGGITYDSWMVLKPWVTAASNCIVPTEVMAASLQQLKEEGTLFFPNRYCPAGDVLGSSGQPIRIAYFEDIDDLGSWIGISDPRHDGRTYHPLTDAPNAAAGFKADLSGKELPNAPRFTVSLGAQHTLNLPKDWAATGRVDWYWQDDSFARVYNTEYDQLKSWNNTNFSFWVEHYGSGLRVEAYVKNAFNESPITGTFLNSDDSGLTTNVFTLDPRLIGLSITKRF